VAKDIKLPKTLGGCVDRLFVIRAERSKLSVVDTKLDEERKAIEQWLIDELPASSAEGITGKLARATVVSKRVGTVSDWGKLQAYIKKTGAFELLSKRLSQEAVAERWDAKKQVPGVEGITVKKISLTKK
jgi:hypothetical protein